MYRWDTQYYHIYAYYTTTSISLWISNIVNLQYISTLWKSHFLFEYVNKSHERVGISQRIGHQCTIIKLLGYGEEYTILSLRAVWWKTYNEHIIDRMLQSKGRMNCGI